MNALHRKDLANEAVRDMVAAADIEVIPLKGAQQKLLLLPRTTTVTITVSPKFGLDRTLEHSVAAAAAGYHVVPHLAARQVVDEQGLRDFVDRLADNGITDLYVIGGDAEEPAGKYTEASDVLEALAALDHGLTSIGVACYPEGHPKIGDDELLDALARKQPYADYMVSQLCFDPQALVQWTTRTRDAGISLPLHLGLAAPMNARKLAGVSLRIGVGSSVRFVSKQHGVVGNLLRGSAYRPETLLRDMQGALADPRMQITGVHLFSFNQVAETVAWQRRVAGLG